MTDRFPRFGDEKVTIVSANPRPVLNDTRFSAQSYSSYGLDINPFDFAYRAETKQEAYVDGLFFAIELAAYPVTTSATVTGRLTRGLFALLREMRD